ncbi:MAG: hypothetical protein WAT74_05695 [Flavobacteriales bacterium]
MDKVVRFETKEESNARREREFMALTPHERLQWFLRSFDGRENEELDRGRRKGNFIIRKKDAPR